ncbi:hypothetical protein GALMADRAFT_137151 [Galerina marginata CBS 339.88]|uniref:Uncharacterized protein n=1 Tax=Galerina marginata (strain CBS 339.88) TaxID=685588 RepID=A0A067TJY1_GALM3|nr:hypothetical protein GALMADRAFT_137151 [Galerina marginata CBS 339.88]
MQSRRRSSTKTVKPRRKPKKLGHINDAHFENGFPRRLKIPSNTTQEAAPYAVREPGLEWLLESVPHYPIPPRGRNSEIPTFNPANESDWEISPIMYPTPATVLYPAPSPVYPASLNPFHVAMPGPNQDPQAYFHDPFFMPGAPTQSVQTPHPQYPDNSMIVEYVPPGSFQSYSQPPVPDQAQNFELYTSAVRFPNLSPTHLEYFEGDPKTDYTHIVQYPGLPHPDWDVEKIPLGPSFDNFQSG